jgi:hypothetical protein
MNDNFNVFAPRLIAGAFDGLALRVGDHARTISIFFSGRPSLGMRDDVNVAFFCPSFSPCICHA